MLKPLRSLQAFRAWNTGAAERFCWSCARRSFSRKLVAEKDLVLLRRKVDDRTDPLLTEPLYATSKAINTTKGKITPSDIIGKGIRDLVYTSKGVAYRICEPTLDEYVRLSPRIVTPIYPADANLIVSLLDLHPTQASTDQSQEDVFEIFEAGTGHGALTLHLARALRLMNDAPVLYPGDRAAFVRRLPNNAYARHISGLADKDVDIRIDDVPLEAFEQDGETKPGLTDAEEKGSGSEAGSYSSEDKQAVRNAQFEEFMAAKLEHDQLLQSYDQQQKKRRAVIHTLDVSARHSAHAQKVVRNYRQGMYYSTIDFHVGTIHAYLSSRLESQPAALQPFLEHAVLDLPRTHEFLELVGRCLKPNGSLVVFCPSITQINACVVRIKERRLPFLLERVLELGAGAGVGGREWDVRAVVPRSVVRAQEEEKAGNGEPSLGGEAQEGLAPGSDGEVEAQESERGWEMVCRPKVGGRVVGGGFLAVFRAMQQV